MVMALMTAPERKRRLILLCGIHPVKAQIVHQSRAKVMQEMWNPDETLH